MLTIIPNESHEPLLSVCDGQMEVDVDFILPDEVLEDNVHIALREKCPPGWKLFVADEVGFSMTSEQARRFAGALLKAAEENDAWLTQK